MRYALTGHSGFLGQHLREKIHDNIYLFNRGGLVSSITDYKPDYIFHLAADIYDKKKMFESNIKLTYDLLEEARKLPELKAFIYIGSSSEYGRKDHPMKETDYLDPTNMYEATKGSGTLLCQAYARDYGVPAMIARPFSLYGQHEPEHRFIPTIISSIRKNRLLKIAPGSHDFIHIDDFIDGLLLLANNPQKGEIYNFGTGIQTQNKDLVYLIEKIMNKEARKQFIHKIHDYDTDIWVADVSKAGSIGWKPKISLIEGLTRVIEETQCH